MKKVYQTPKIDQFELDYLFRLFKDGYLTVKEYTTKVNNLYK